MEERVPLSTKENNPIQGTYHVVRIHKDRVYRVPPPENAEIVDRGRQNAKKTETKGRHGRCICWLFTVIVVLSFIAAVCFSLWRFTLDPQPMSFVATHVDVKQPPASKKAGFLPGFQITLISTNPNNVNNIRIEEGIATLGFQNKEISKGRFPAMQHDAGKTRTVELVLIGSAKGALPKELQEASDPQRKNKKAVILNLQMEIPVKMETWIMDIDVYLKYGCDLELSSMGEDAKLLSDKCRLQ